MAVDQGKLTQLRISFPEHPSFPDPRQFSSPNEFAHYCVDNCGLQHKAIAGAIEMSSSLLTQKLHGITASLTADEYFRVARALIRLGKEEWGRLMFKFFAIQLLPPPGRKEKLVAERKAIRTREEEINRELESLES